MFSKQPRPRPTGFSLVEIMVGMLIGLIGILVIMQVFAVSEGQKRTTTGSGDAQTNGAIALYMMERDIRQGGYGFASLDLLNCNVKAYNEQRTPPDFTLQPMAPFVINPANVPAGDPNTDVVVVTYGNSDGLGEGVGFQQQSGASANYKVTNRAGFTVGEMVIAAQPGLDCTVAQITDLPASGSCGMGGGGGQTDVIIHNAGNFKDPYQNCDTVQSHWNKPGGLGVTYTTGKLYSLGRLPRSVAYAVRGGKLTACDFFASDCSAAAQTTNPAVWVPVADNIVGLQAQYGRDTSAPMDMTVDVYDKTTPADACGYARIPAVRLGVLARSTQYEKETVTTGDPAWQGGTFTISGLPDWSHYRYKVFQTVIPLRNIIWMGVQAGC
jgi:type IV pilus assembly protein PilW